MKYPPVFIVNEPKMIPLRSRIPLILLGLVVLAGGIAAVYSIWQENHPVGVNELWEADPLYSLVGETRTVSGEILFEPLSGFQFNGIFLVDPATTAENRSPEAAFWFGIRINGVSCTVDDTAKLVTCTPFDPTQATAYQFKGNVQLETVGKKDIMWLADVDFEHSRQLVNGEWQPIPLGEFTFPLENADPGN